MKILQVKKFPIYDIFTGSGWLNWTRILIDKSKKLSVIAGEPIHGGMPDNTMIKYLQDQAKLSRKSNQQVSNANKS